MLPPPINQLIHQFSKLPGIGPRQATRFAFYLLRNKDEFDTLINDLESVGANISLCENCFLPAFAKTSEGRPTQNSLCSICLNSRRDKNAICVIEKETDALNLEKAGYFQGHYYVLGGFINPLYEDSVAHKRADLFIKKIKNWGQTSDTARSDPGKLEIILALTPRREGDFTSHYIEEKLKPIKEQNANIKISRLGRGLSSGAELEYADDETLKNAFERRR